MAHKIERVSGDENRDLLRRSWTLPVLASLHSPSHFNDIKRNLITVTDRALSQSLKSMEDRHWVSRRVDGAARPPRPTYSAVNAGKLISSIAAPVISFHP